MAQLLRWITVILEHQDLFFVRVLSMHQREFIEDPYKIWKYFITFVAGSTLPPGYGEHQALLPPPPEEDMNSDDCCSFWFCLGTSKDEQAKIIQTSCSCSESDACSHRHQRFHSSYDSFAEYNPRHPPTESTDQDPEPVGSNGSLPRVPTSHEGSPRTGMLSRDSPSILQPSIHNTEEEAGDDVTA